MKKLLIILLLFTSLSSVGQTVQDYVQEFRYDAVNYGKFFSRESPRIVLVPNELHPIVGGVTVNSSAYVDHTINTIYFSTISNAYCYELKRLVYHELGHYYLRRNHNDAINPSTGMAVSIMSAEWDEDWGSLCTEDQEMYIDELFTQY